jgi:hypothetical protein
MSNSLYALVAESQNITSALIESGGQLSPELEEALINLEVKLPSKIDAYAAVLERMEMEEEYWKAKAKQYQSIAKGCLNVREKIKESLKTAAEALGSDELLGVDSRFKITNSNPKLIIDQQLLSEDYLVKKVIFEPDSDKIKDDLKAGKEISGAWFLNSKSIRIYANKGAK